MKENSNSTAPIKLVKYYTSFCGKALSAAGLYHATINLQPMPCEGFLVFFIRIRGLDELVEEVLDLRNVLESVPN